MPTNISTTGLQVEYIPKDQWISSTALQLEYSQVKTISTLIVQLEWGDPIEPMIAGMLLRGVGK